MAPGHMQPVPEGSKPEGKVQLRPTVDAGELQREGGLASFSKSAGGQKPPPIAKIGENGQEDPGTGGPQCNMGNPPDLSALPALPPPPIQRPAAVTSEQSENEACTFSNFSVLKTPDFPPPRLFCCGPFAPGRKSPC